MGMAVGLVPVPGRVVTELDALDLLGWPGRWLVGRGGISGAEGASTFLVEDGSEETIRALLGLLRNIKGAVTSGIPSSMEECLRCGPGRRGTSGASTGGTLNSGGIPMKKVIGTVTIGQSPRTDVIPDVASILGPDIEIREAGALDGLSPEIIASFAPGEGDYVLVTRLADGSSVQVAERHITPRIHEKIAEHFTGGIPVVLLLCTGEFPDFETGGLLIRPQKVLFNAVAAVAKGMRIGILTPSPSRWISRKPVGQPEPLRTGGTVVAVRRRHGGRPESGGGTEGMEGRNHRPGLHRVHPGHPLPGPGDNGKARPPRQGRRREHGQRADRLKTPPA